MSLRWGSQSGRSAKEEYDQVDVPDLCEGKPSRVPQWLENSSSAAHAAALACHALGVCVEVIRRRWSSFAVVSKDLGRRAHHILSFNTMPEQERAPGSHLPWEHGAQP